jgi:hypothetical protein
LVVIGLILHASYGSQLVTEKTLKFDSEY